MQKGAAMIPDQWSVPNLHMQTEPGLTDDEMLGKIRRYVLPEFPRGYLGPHCIPAQIASFFGRFSAVTVVSSHFLWSGLYDRNGNQRDRVADR
jgi:hypothetical protein